MLIAIIFKTLRKTTPGDGTTADELKNKQILYRSMQLRMHGGYISDDAFLRRKMFLIRKKDGALRAKVPGPANPMR